MKIKIYQIDAFSNKPFQGNPAAICPLDQWLSDEMLQNIAMENNLSETAFFVPNQDNIELRWFTPKGEVKLCGHATLATAYVLFNELNYESDQIIFDTLSGALYVSQNEENYVMTFPQTKIEHVETPIPLSNALGESPIEVWQCDDYIAVYSNQHEIEQLNPDFGALAQINCRGICVTAPGLEVDFVSRFFAPRHAINEDPVTGSAHCYLAPYWGKKLGKTQLHAMQLSKRSGHVYCELKDNRVLLAGSAIKFLEGYIHI